MALVNTKKLYLVIFLNKKMKKNKFKNLNIVFSKLNLHLNLFFLRYNQILLIEILYKIVVEKKLFV